VVVVWLVLDLVRQRQPPGPLAVPAPPPNAAADRSCPAVLDTLPDTLDDLAARTVTSESAHVAAWGEPAVVLRCGVPTPPGFRRGSAPIEVNGVAWFQRVDPGVVTWTTVDRPVNVEVAVPVVYESQGGLLVEFAAPIARALPEVVPRPR